MIRGRTKPYDKQLDEYSRVGELVIVPWVRGKGYKVTHHPHGECGRDFSAVREGERFYIDAERRRAQTWNDGLFRWLEINVPERRGINDDTLIFVVRKDLQQALIIFPNTIRDAELKENRNTFVDRGELFYKVPRCQALPIDLNQMSPLSIAEMNAERIRRGYDEMGYNPKPAAGLSAVGIRMLMLGKSTPYGMTTGEWHDLLDRCNDEMHEAFLRT